MGRLKSGLRHILLHVFTRETLHRINVDLHFFRTRVRNKRFKDFANLKPDAEYLNLGCGPHGVKSELWLNADGWPADNVDVSLDLRQQLPFSDGRFKGIFTEHFFEHLEYEQATVFLTECLRILKPGGIVRISVPDGQLYLDKYFSDRDWMIKRRNGRFETPMQEVNEIFRQEYQHRFCYDFETIELLMKQCGFGKVDRVDFGTGGDEALQIDREIRRFESLYVEGQKVN